MLHSEMMFTDFLVEWLADQKQYLAFTSWEGYDLILSNHTIPFFMSRNQKLCDIKGYHIQEYYNYMLNDKGLSPNTLRKHNAILHKAFADCLFMDLLMFNPCDKTRLPKKRNVNTNVYSAFDVRQLLERVKGYYLEAPIFLTAYYGFRRSEVLALKWSDVDFDGKYIKVQRSVTRVKTFVVKDGLKSESSYRIMPLFDTVERYLTELQEKQKQIGIYGYDDFICKKADGRLINPDILSKGFNRFLKQNGLPHIRFHDLRHSNVSILLNNGMSLKHISEWAGHSNINITADIYGHLDYNSKVVMGDKINEILKAERGE